MSNETTISIKNVAIPLTIVVSILFLSATAFTHLGKLQSAVEQNTKGWTDNAKEIRNLPTRNEFQTLQTDISEIKRDLKTLIGGHNSI
jgi:hypothetical protein